MFVVLECVSMLVWTLIHLAVTVVLIAVVSGVFRHDL